MIADQSGSGGIGGLVVAGSGEVALSAANAFTGGVSLQSGTLDLAVAGAAGSGNILFDPADATLQIDGTVMPTNTIVDFIAGDTIDLTGIIFDASNTPTYSGNTFEIVNNGTTLASLTITGKPYTASDFFLSKDAGTGTEVTTDLPCFLARTRIATDRGERAVEELRAGDRALTAAGEAKAIRWIGHRRLDCTSHPRPELVRPVRIRADAFGDGEPRRDLWLSPDHSVFREGVLIPIKYLLNGATIVQERVDAVHYFHVELDGHDVLLAEGLPAESYLDTGNRAAFANGGAQIALYPDFRPLNWDEACAPLCTEGRKLAAVRRHLRRRLPERVELRLGQRRIGAVAVEGRLYRFLLPAGAREVAIVSSTISSNQAGRRGEPGVCIVGIVADGRIVPLDSPALIQGFYPLEHQGGQFWRWTDGNAMLDLRSIGAPRVLEVLIDDVIARWHEPYGAAAEAA